MGLTSLIAPAIKEVLSFIPNPAERQKAEQEFTTRLVEIEASQMKDQVELNKIEAGHASIFVAGWRPFIGWTGGVALAWTYVLQPVLSWFAVVLFGYIGTFPTMESAPLLTLITAMLGVGTMRSVDKFLKTDTKRIK